jgi:molybdate transport system substrate-binding protein
VANVDAVPAGKYGKSALEKLGGWDKVKDNVAQADNVRAALALVSAGEAPLGVTYATDAVADPDVSVVGTFPAGSYPPIIYPAALLKNADDASARSFYQALSGKAAGQIFEAQGFRMLN